MTELPPRCNSAQYDHVIGTRGAVRSRDQYPRCSPSPPPLLLWPPSPQHVEVCGVCARQDRRAESEGPQPEAAGHLRLHLPPPAVWRAAAQAPDPAQGPHRVSANLSLTPAVFNNFEPPQSAS